MTKEVGHRKERVLGKTWRAKSDESWIRPWPGSKVKPLPLTPKGRASQCWSARQRQDSECLILAQTLRIFESAAVVQWLNMP